MMNAEFFAAIEQIEREKGISKEYMREKITQALMTAFKRDNAGVSDNVVVDMNEERREIKVFVQKTVVEDVFNPAVEISLEDARRVVSGADLGDRVNIVVPTQNFGRIAAQTAKQVIIQGIREAERGVIFQEYTSKEHEVLSAVVTRTDKRNAGLILEIGGKNEKTEALLAVGEQVQSENLKEGDRIKVYVVEVRKSPRGHQILISRTHPGLVKRLFELEVPEISDGTVEIRSVAREAGHRTKIAVWSQDENVDPIGACIGPKGQRVNSIVAELRNEKIDIVRYSDDPAEFIAQALAPANVVSVEVNDDSKTCRVVVPEDQLSLAIGKEGQNARLAAKLTGFKIDIRSDTRDEE